MKFLKSIIVLTCLTISVSAQDTLVQNQPDTTKKEEIKTGWNYGFLPVVAYNSDLGFQYGLIVNPFYYGDGSTYPNYKHKLYLEASRYTKGSGIYRVYFHSRYLIPNINFIADASYLPDEAYDFYGFNGNQTNYFAEWTQPDNVEYVSSMFYKTQRKFLRAKVEFQGKTKVENLGWVAGLTFRDIKMNRPDFAKINEGKDVADIVPSDSTLYDKYLDWGIINADEKNGGVVTSIKTGLVYDSRDVEANPNSGTWTEAVLSTSPSFLGTTKSFVRFNITHRQYFTIIPKRMTFAYRGIFQTNLLGETPFYILPEVETSVMNAATNEGLGGSATLRGLKRNRIQGNSIAMLNAEFRYKIVKFIFAKQNIYIGTNIFYDTGLVLDPIEFDLVGVSKADKDLYFTTENKGLHNAAGIGLKIAMNENFILSVEKGYAFSKTDGDSGMYIRLNYLF